MQMPLRSLRFNIPDNPFASNAKKLTGLSDELKKLTRRAGKDNDKFKLAWKKLFKAIQNKKSIETILIDKVDIRALGFALTTEYKDKIRITENVLNRIDRIAEKPSSLFIQDFFQYYLNDFNRIDNINFVSQWLIKARETRKVNQWYDEKLLSPNGAKWVADLAITEQKDFNQIIHELELDHFQSGQFMESAQMIYYVEQLRNIPVNQHDDLLLEVQKRDVFESKFNESELLGHQILKILIEKAPAHDIHDSWLNTVMSIAGDPRIPVGNPRYIKWWSHIDKNSASKVKGWLSGLDIKRFLEALEDFSHSSNDSDMKRMFPARKKFLEGLYDKKLIKNTKLYMCKHMAYVLTQKYKKEHLPDFSIIEDSEKSIIYVDLETAHLIEGSHQCQLWIYRTLHDSAPVLQYNKQRLSYRNLTMGLHESMENYGQGAYDHFIHSPAHFSWQRRAVQSLKDLSVPITMKDILTANDYRAYVRKFGVN
jgi:hypothetical protein